MSPSCSPWPRPAWGSVAVVSADLHGLDLGLVHRLSQRGVLVLGLYPTGDDGAERRLRQLRIPVVLPVEATAEAFSAAVAGPDRGSHARAPSPTDLPVVGAGDVSGQLRVPDHVPDDLGDTAVPPTAPPTRLPARIRSPRSALRRGTVTTAGLATARLRAGRRPVEGLGPTNPVDDRCGLGTHGGPGRTTLAVNLAAEIASRSREVLLVDADTYGGSVAQVLGLLDEAPGIAAACRAADHGTLDLPALARLAPVVMPGLRVLTGLPKAERWPEPRAAALERVLELGRGLAQVIVVDCGFCIENDEELSYDTAAPRRNEATLTTLAEADTVLAVGSADPVGLQRFVRASRSSAPSRRRHPCP